MNMPSSTIQAAGVYGAVGVIAMIALAVFAPEYYERIPPGGSEAIVVSLSTIGGYFKKETVLK